MKKLLFVSLLFLCTLSYHCSFAKEAEQKLDQIIAVVNDDVITESELNRAMNTARIQLDEGELNATAEKNLQKKLLDQIINRKLQLQLAQQNGVKVSDEDVDNTILKIAEQNNVSVEALYHQLNKEGMTTEHYRNEMRDQIILRKLQQQEVVNRLNVSPQEVEAFIHSKAWQNNESKEYRISDILIPLPEAPSSDDLSTAKTRAEAIMGKLNEGHDFHEIIQSELAKKHTLQNDDLGWRKLPEIPSAFAEHVAHMKAKEIAGPIQTPNGLHIIRVAAMRSLASEKSPPNRKKVEDLLLERKFEEAVQVWMSRLRSQAYIENKLDHVA